MKIDRTVLKNGFRRIFISVSILFLLMGVFMSFDDFRCMVGFSVAAAINYLLFLFICWIVKGFTREKMDIKEHFNYKVMFYVLLVICLGLFTICYFQNKKIDNFQTKELNSYTENENLTQQISEQEQKIQELEQLNQDKENKISALKQKNKNKLNGGYFSIGSNKSEVIAVQGQPDKIVKFPDGSEEWQYDVNM